MDMTAKEIFELRKNGHVEDAYEAARQLYASDKSPYASSAMFWTAVDMCKARVGEGCIEEATKICMAIERIMPSVPDREGWAKDAFERCKKLLQNATGKKDLLQNEPQHITTGVWGEEMAAAYLREKGYVILERDWHSGHRDIDIIARTDEYLVFVEVKTRRNTLYGVPELSVGFKKRRNLLHAINHYVRYRKIYAPIRFDIITVIGQPGAPNPIINHIEGVDIMRA